MKKSNTTNPLTSLLIKEDNQKSFVVTNFGQRLTLEILRHRQKKTGMVVTNLTKD